MAYLYHYGPEYKLSSNFSYLIQTKTQGSSSDKVLNVFTSCLKNLNTCSSNVLKGNMIYYFTGQAKLEKCNISFYIEQLHQNQRTCTSQCQALIGLAQNN